MAKERHGWHNAQVRLAVEGKDQQEEDSVGMKIEGVEIIMAEDGVEEVRERGDQPDEDALREERIGGTAQCFRLDRAGPERYLSSFIAAARRH